MGTVTARCEEMELKNLSSNWKKLQSQLQKDRPSTKAEQSKEKGPSSSLKRKKSSIEEPPATTKRLKHGKSLRMEPHKSAESQQLTSEDAKDLVDAISRKSLDGQRTTRPLTATNRENEGLAVG